MPDDADARRVHSQVAERGVPYDASRHCHDVAVAVCAFAGLVSRRYRVCAVSQHYDAVVAAFFVFPVEYVDDLARDLKTLFVRQKAAERVRYRLYGGEAHIPAARGERGERQACNGDGASHLVNYTITPRFP